MTTYRLCGHRSEVCTCSDLEAQPCIAALIADYLDELRSNVIFKGAEGAPGDEISIGAAHNLFLVTTESFPTITACERWSIQCGTGSFFVNKK